MKNEKQIEKNINKYGEATLYLFDYAGYEIDQKEAAEYIFNSNNCKKHIIFQDYSVYQDVKTKIWFGNVKDLPKLNLMWRNDKVLINNIKFNCNYGEKNDVDAEMRQIFKQIRSKY